MQHLLESLFITRLVLSCLFPSHAASLSPWWKISSDLKKHMERKQRRYRWLSFGSSQPQAVYQDIKSIEDFAIRLISKRPAVFFTSNDLTILRTGQRPNPNAWRYVRTELIALGSLQFPDCQCESIEINFIAGWNWWRTIDPPQGLYQLRRDDDIRLPRCLLTNVFY